MGGLGGSSGLGEMKNSHPKRRRKRRCSKTWPAWLVKTLNVLEVTDNPANAGEHTCCHLLKAQKWRWWCEELHFVWNSAAFLVPKKEVTGWGQHLLLSRLSLAWTWQHIKRNMALQYPQIFLLLSKRKKLASSRSINLIIFVIDRCLWRPSKAQKDEKLISIFKNAAFGRGRLQWGDDKKCFPGAVLCRSNSPPLLHVAALPCPCWYLVDKTRSACRLDHYRLMRNIPWE